MLGVHFRTIHRLIKQKKLKAIRVGREFRISRQDYDEYLRQHRTA
jgi:excisionase family DNA binding protein